MGLLRQPGERERPATPAAELARLEELIGSFAATGLKVTCEVIGRARPLPEAVDLTAYRLIQESLTNTTKHAAGACAAGPAHVPARACWPWPSKTTARIPEPVTRARRPRRDGGGAGATHGARGPRRRGQRRGGPRPDRNAGTAGGRAGRRVVQARTTAAPWPWPACRCRSAADVTARQPHPQPPAPTPPSPCATRLLSRCATTQNSYAGLQIAVIDSGSDLSVVGTSHRQSRVQTGRRSGWPSRSALTWC